MSVSAKKGARLPVRFKNAKRMSLDDVLELPCLAVPQQTICKEDAEYYGIRSSLDEETGEEITATYFPYYNQKGKLVGYKVRDWTLPKEQKGHFSVVGHVGVDCMLFGQHKCTKNPKKSIIFVEGEGDCVATRRACIDSLKGTKFEGKLKQVNVVSLQCGAGNAQASCAHNEAFLRSGKNLIIRMDADKATVDEARKGVVKGEEAMSIIAGFLMMDNMFTFDLFPDMKDPRDMVEAGKAVELGNLITFDLKPYRPEKMVSPEDYDIDELRKAKKYGIPFPQFPRLSRTCLGPLEGELWIVTGAPGAGKSTITRFMEYDIYNYLANGLPEVYAKNPKVKGILGEDGKYRLEGYEPGEKLGIFRLEEDKNESMNALIALDNGLDPKDFANDPTQFMDKETHLKALEKFKSNDCIRILDHFGSMPINDLLNKIKQFYSEGCRWFILDHITMVISGEQVADDRKELDIVLTKLAALCKQLGIFILVVSHVNREYGKQKVNRNKDGELIPFWIECRKEQLRGTSSLEALGFFIMSVEPEELPNRSRGRVRLVSLKNRRGKQLGIQDVLYMKDGSRFENAIGWEYNNGLYMKDGETVVDTEEGCEIEIEDQDEIQFE